MKVSYNWIKEYVEFDWEAEELAHKLTMAGLEVEEIQEFSLDSEKIVVGKILEIKKHPDADKLHICITDIGDKKVQVICGAPNTKERQYVVTALPGALLPSGINVEETKIRGVVSEGMLCSEKELGISDDHSGITVLNDGKPGEIFRFGKESRDIVLDLFINPNRVDCMSLTGVAREIAALNGSKMKLPEFELEEDEGKIEDFVNIEILDKINCPRYTARAIRDIKIEPSPSWMVRRLNTIGIRAINNIVDITNYVLMELGQPMHAFDMSKITDNKIIVRLAGDGERFVTLDEVGRELDSKSLLICDGKRTVALAGIMGGMNSEVSQKTKNILLESAYFNPLNIRRTSQKLGLSTEASIRFERGVDSRNIDFASARAISLMRKNAGGKVITGCLDVDYVKREKKCIVLRPERITKILGKEIPEEKIISILKGLELEVKKDKDLIINEPDFRNDLTREIDLIEEIARIYDYDNIEEAKFANINIQIKNENYTEKYLDNFRNIFIGMGFYEIITNSMVGSRQEDWVKSEDELIKLKNPISEEMIYMRKTLIESVLKVMEYNKNRKQKNVRIFEIGNVFSPEKGTDPAEFESINLCGALEGTIESPNWKLDSLNIDFYYVKGILETFFNKIFLDNYEIFYYDKTWLTECCGIKINNVFSGFFGRFENNYLDIPGKNDIYVFELYLDNIINKISRKKLKFTPIPQFPSIERDLVLIVSKGISAKDLINCIKSNGGVYLKKIDVFDLYEGKQIKENQKSIGFSLQFYSLEKTLNELEIDKVIEKILIELHNSFGAKLREK